MIRTAPRRAGALVAVVVLVTTGVLAWLAAEVNERANRELLSRQVAQAATVLENAVEIRQVQLADAAYVAAATNAATGPFEGFAADRITGTGSFVSLSLLRVGAGPTELLVTAGEDPLLPEGGLDSPFFTDLQPSGQLAVAGILPGEPRSLGYALMPEGDTSDLVVYAEQPLVPDRRSDPPEQSAFAGLEFAVYVGDTTDPEQLVVATGPLPIGGGGETATTTLPFGDTMLTVVGAAREQLTGALPAALPWIVVGVGVALALASAATIETLSRRRALAEGLAAENERLYLQQRGIAGTLQHALLPAVPDVDGLEVAARYLAGGDELDVGGDWYDVIARGPGRCVFVVGDISGSGLPAATTMAALRFAVRAYLAQGDDIATVITRLRRLLSVEVDHQFATVLIGELDVVAGQLRVVCAGHFPPLLVAEGRGEPVDCPIDPPIGVDSPSPAAAVELRLPDAGTIVAFTDGLVERRGEVVDSGLDRLRESAAALDGRPLESLLDDLMGALSHEGTKDDTVVLGLRWPAGAATTGVGSSGSLEQLAGDRR